MRKCDSFDMITGNPLWSVSRSKVSMQNHHNSTHTSSRAMHITTFFIYKSDLTSLLLTIIRSTTSL